VKPIDVDEVLNTAKKYCLLVTIEENTITGGAGSGINALLAENGFSTPVMNLGIPDQFIEHGGHDEQRAWIGLNSQGIVQRIDNKLASIDARNSPVPKLTIGIPIEIIR
jgi:1-deoxy-D-xylulose-5-phosphate synthase